MEINVTFIGVIIVLLIFVPIIYLIISAGGKEKKIRKTISQLSQNNGIQLKNIDFIGNCIIAVDEVSKKLVYTSKTNPTGDFKIINMEDIKDCRAKSIKQSDKTLDWVGLEFVEKTGRLEIPFYIESNDEEFTRDPFVCLQDAKRWENTLKPLLKAS
ncbi:hypothetical protein [Aequorivita lipolytica]|uniref:Uncharacterized protein n=1 Tax=Aequorivita lipolytica TaxID=153267 RepID=A0A5C6YSY1_9FLAO|nr:hypothetical protein [Aequorivita lipolytica]TXD70407.1 hypothetical protein ESV24_04365 [Aequorivita lipolytica]SRX50836.1 hypothetical protein AEQU2_01314 [Aequorivita lipolytica]